MRDRRLRRVPNQLSVTVFALAACGCAPTPASGDVVSIDAPVTGAVADTTVADGSLDASGPCSHVMPGLTCFTTCEVLGSSGLEEQPCEVYCPTVEGDANYCNDADGRLDPNGCMWSRRSDGGTYVFC
jgi:hypothetical protein